MLLGNWKYLFYVKKRAKTETITDETDLTKILILIIFPYYLISYFLRCSETAFEYMKLLSEIDHCVMRMVFDSYGVDAKECDRLIDSTLYLSRFMKYRSPREGEGIMGLFPHSDKSFLAVLDDDLKGLEIQMKNGEWIYPEPSPSTFIVLAGEPFMVILRHWSYAFAILKRFNFVV